MMAGISGPLAGAAVGGGYFATPTRTVVAVSAPTALAIATDRITKNDGLVEYDVTNAPGGAFTAYLPGAVSSRGLMVAIKRIDSSASTLTLQDVGGANIDDAATLVLSGKYATLELQSDGAQWRVRNASKGAGSALPDSLSLQPAQDTTAISNVGMTIIGPDIIAAANTMLNRQGSPAVDFTDTTDTAANIIAAIPQGFKASAAAGNGWLFTYINTTSQRAVLTPGAGVTIISTGAAANASIPRLSSLQFIVTQTSPNNVFMVAVTASRLISYPPMLKYPVTQALGTTIPFSDPSDMKYLIRSGPTAAFTDTTDTAANIVSLIPGPAALNLTGLTWTLRYINTTNFPATLAGGAGVTMAPSNTIGAGYWVDFMYQITATSPAAIAITRVGSGGV